jgi:hypothetical protein
MLSCMWLKEKMNRKLFEIMGNEFWKAVYCIIRQGIRDVNRSTEAQLMLYMRTCFEIKFSLYYAQDCIYMFHKILRIKTHFSFSLQIMFTDL